MRLADAVWPQVDAATRDVLVVPLGSLEQHGPHLPLDTDTTVAAAVAEQVVARRPGAGLAPAVPLGASGEHAHFPGTVSIGTAALELLLVELVRDACRTWGAVLAVTGHGGNAEALRGAKALCRTEGRHLGVVGCGLPGMDAHAGRAETALMLHLSPDRVRLDRAEAGTTDDVRSLLPRMQAGGVRAVSANGVLGDPAGASAAEGSELLARLVAQALRAYDALPSRPPTGPADAGPAA